MRDSQTVPTATFDHFFFFFWVGCSVLSFFFLLFSLVRSIGLQVWVIYFLFFILALESLGTEKKFFLSDEN